MKMGVIIMVGMVWLSMTMTPLSAQDNPLGLPDCWAKMDACITNAGIDVQDLTASYALCCPVIKPQVANTTCFCSIKDYLQNIPNDQPGVLASASELFANKALGDCKIDSTFDQLCNGVSKSEGGSESSGTGKLPGVMKNEASKITSVIGLVPGALFVWAMIMP